jgi:hypothetical protein
MSKATLARAAILSLVIVAPAAAQTGVSASIVGQVTDESGAVLPGVTVSATSPALQVPQIVAVTTERGEYRLMPLPIGTYNVEYVLSGFQTVRREGVRLTAGFVATVDVALKVGSLQESVTVSGASPVVDVHSTGSRAEFTQETLQSIPSGRNGIISLLNQTPSVRSNFDVGGSASSDTVSLRVYGIASESWQTLEGIVTTEQRDTQGGNYFDYNTFEEARAQTLSNEANVPNRGVYLNMIVKSGSNAFHGTTSGAWTADKLQSDNVDDNLRQMGFVQTAQLRKRWDASQDFGGPIASNRLWFYVAVRSRVQNRETLGLKPDGSPFTIDQSQKYATTKLSYQLSPANRFVGFYYYNTKLEIGGNNTTPFIQWESRSESNVHSPMGKVEWQALKGSSFVSSLQYSFWRWTAIRPIYEGVGPSASDIATQAVWGLNSTAGNDSGAWRMCSSFPDIQDTCRPMLSGSASWYRPNVLFGNHELKAGFDYIPNSTSRPWRPRDVGDYRLVFNNGAPFQIVTVNAPTTSITSAIHSGIYVKDNWTLRRRVTLNLGIRYANDNGFVPAQCRADGQFAVAACTERIQDTTWNSWAPRLYAAYDLAGNSKTVVKGGWGRFAHFRTTDEVLALNPFVGTQSTYRWRDLNGNRNYDAGEVNLDPNGTDFVSSSVTDNSAPTGGIVNPNEKQPMEDEFSAEIEHQLMANFAVRASGRYSRRFNILRRLYPYRPYDAYNIPITKRDPGPDGVVGTADDGQLITYYDFPAALGGRQFQQNELVNDPNATETFKTIELSVTKRLSGRWQVIGSYSATKNNIPVPAYSDFNPNNEINTADRSWETLIRLSGIYQFPAGISGSFNYDHRSGLARARQALFIQAGAQVPSIVLNVEPLGSQHDPDTNIVDLRAAKTVGLGKATSLELQVNLFNLFNVNTPTGVNYRSGASYLLPTAIVLPRVLEFGANFKF